MNQKQIFKQTFKIERKHRIHLKKHNAFVLWFTGLSGSGKSTVASNLEVKLFKSGINTYILDGDNLRYGLNSDLGFSDKDREENIRRTGEVAKLFYDAGNVTLTTLISPFIKDRKKVRELFPSGDFIEVFLKCDLEECKKRDPKGLYKKVATGEINNFTGITSPYEKPESPEIMIDTGKLSINECVDEIIFYLKENNFLNY